MSPAAVHFPVAGSYSSVEARIASGASSAPATRTLPSVSRVAVCSNRGDVMVPVAVQRPVFGLYSSDSAIAPLGSPTDGQPFVAGPGHLPPATRTRPLGSSVAVCHARGWIMSPVLLHVPARGSYSSADASALVVDSSVESSPPATR